ncbi:M1 family metallopeptidase [Cellulomonas pakistanensis]|uniref:Aminopeptidase N n=1 Tax=Cellulomonas pakistanensis TaxID=992287 RepID=A0A919PA54_9CELL|nr:M1 family metallopeptidase [Cellulomonas pakistanensis]GIG35810.1 putative peptidase M1, membrane alanine aminopeptidase [Cellulomonas pakistanensis]
MSAAPGPAEAPDPYLPDRVPGGLHVTRYELELDYRVATNRLDAVARVHAVAAGDLERLSLDLVGLKVSRVLVDGHRPARFAQRDGRLEVRLARPVAAGGALVVEVQYAGQPGPRRGPWGEVGWEELTDGVIVAGQPDGAPSWFPCDDRPGAKAAYRIVVTTEAGYEVVCNGRLVSRRARSSRVTWEFVQDEPTAPYLATVQVGRYERTALADGPVPQDVVAPPRLRAQQAHDFARQPAMVELFVDRFGPYPFPRYDVVVTDDPLEIPLEAHGLSVFGANHVDGHRGTERLVAHELAHQWFGNSLTAATWRDIWLHEGFAAYAEWLWEEHAGGRSADAIARTARTRLAALPQDLVIGDPGRESMFDDRLYKRGALTLHALRISLGDDDFFGVLREWTARYRHGSVTTELFAACVAEVSGRDVGRLLHQWLAEPALPALPAAPRGRVARAVDRLLG